MPQKPRRSARSKNSNADALAANPNEPACPCCNARRILAISGSCSRKEAGWRFELEGNTICDFGVIGVVQNETGMDIYAHGECVFSQAEGANEFHCEPGPWLQTLDAIRQDLEAKYTHSEGQQIH
ncbi:MAG: hypothetical protein JO141_27000 [Bradyrhizobium sp.]|nr:hypothetical protein [Bradyrhizobium sp.]